MAFNRLQLRRADMFAQIADYGARTDTTTYNYNYRTTEAASVVETANYFDPMVEAQRGDVISCVMNNGVGATPVFKEYIFTTGIASGDAHNTVVLQTGTAG